MTPWYRTDGAVAAVVSLAVMTALVGVLAVHKPPRPAERVVEQARAAVVRLAPPAPPEPPPAPEALQDRLATLAAVYRDPVGIAVIDVAGGWEASVEGEALFPQQSVSKLWVALSILDAVDRGGRKLDEVVTLSDEDRSVFYQPIAARIDDDGLPITLRQLLEHALIESDNAANDKLIRELGGPQVVGLVLGRKKLRGLRLGAAERDLQAGVAGMNWQPRYGFGRIFQQEREALPGPARDAAMAAYLDDPPDGAKPLAIARALVQLHQGRLLSPSSTALMIEAMTEARTGPRRLKGGLPADWSIAHKTGTGQDWRGASVGINDVGLITAPDGRTYAVVVMIRRTRRPVPERLALFQQVSRAVVESWRAEQASRAGVKLRPRS